MKKYVCLLLLVVSLPLMAETANSDIRNGNWDFKSGKATSAEVSYRKALQKDPASVEATYNLAGSLFSQGKVKEATEAYERAASLTDNKKQLSQIYHNLGNSYYLQKEYGKSVEAYKRSLKANPQDEDTRYNLAMALRQLQQQQNQQQQQQQNQEQQDQQQQQQQQPQQPQQQQQSEDELSKENAKQILDAFQQQEQELKEKMQQQSDGQRNLDKDW